MNILDFVRLHAHHERQSTLHDDYNDAELERLTKSRGGSVPRAESNRGAPVTSSSTTEPSAADLSRLTKCKP